MPKKLNKKALNKMNIQMLLIYKNNQRKINYLFKTLMRNTKNNCWSYRKS